MKYISTLLILFMFSAVSAQKMNRDSVKLLILDSTSATYYPKLLERFNKFDTTLTIVDYKLLYYGYVFQEDYSAYVDTKEREINAAIDERDYSRAILMADTVLRDIPISLKANYKKAVALYLMDNLSLNYTKYINRYASIIKAILSTGDGLTCATAFKVIFVADEYEIMYKHFEIEKFNGQSLVYPCDKMSIEPNGNFKEPAIYFDISESFIKMNEMFKEDDKPNKKKKHRN